MYNKLFTKILDSSIWLAPDPHRLVWVTIIAAMNRHGVAEFACAENLAARARVSVEDTRAAITAFESPDPFDPSQEFEGRRIEKLPGGWLVLNAEKYRNAVSPEVSAEQARERMRRMRDREKNRSKVAKTDVITALRNVTPSDHTQIISKSDQSKPPERKHARRASSVVSADSKSKRGGGEAPTLHASLPTKEWDEWIEYRRRRHWPIDSVTLGKHLKELAGFSTTEQVRMLDKSIGSGWQGVFPEKGSKKITAATQPSRTADQIQADETAAKDAAAEQLGRLERYVLAKKKQGGKVYDITLSAPEQLRREGWEQSIREIYDRALHGVEPPGRPMPRNHQ